MNDSKTQSASSDSALEKQHLVSSPIHHNSNNNGGSGSSSTSNALNISNANSSVNDDSQQQQPQQTPLPKRIFVPVVLTLFMESISYVTPMPFIGSYVAHLTSSPVTESGRYSGLIIGCFYLGTILSGSWWGRLSDQFGRKPVILVGLVASALLELAFGLAHSIWVCLLVRLAQGVMNATQVCSKTVIAESTDSTNEALGFSLMSLAWSGGVFIGMFNGGLYGVGEPELFGMTFPAFLPCLMMSIFAFVCAAIIFVVFPETNQIAIPMTWPALREFFASGGVVTAGMASRRKRKTDDEDDNDTTKNNNSNASASAPSSSVLVMTSPTTSSSPSTEGASATTTSAQPPAAMTEDFTTATLWRTPGLRAAMVDYLLLSSHEIAFDETFPLIAVSPATVAGFSMTVSEVAMTILYSGLFMIASVFAFPVVRRWYGDYVFVYASCVLCFCYVAIPQFELAAPEGWKFLPLAVLFPFRTWANDFCYSQALLVIPREAPREHVGTVTSMSTSYAAIVRLLVPPLASALFSLTVTTGVEWLYPYNSTVTFAVCSLLALTAAVHRRNWILRTGKF